MIRVGLRDVSWSKIAVVTGVLVTLVAVILLAATSVDVRAIAPSIFVAAALAAFLDKRVVALPAATVCLFPAFLLTATGQYDPILGVLWVALLLGAILPDLLARPWSIPARWRVPLIAWVAVALVASLVVAFREADFHPELLFRARLSGEVLNAVPRLNAVAATRAALAVGLGVLWFEWLLSQPSGFLVRWVFAPMAAGAALMGGVAAYQMFVDLAFLNPTTFLAYGRATGTLLDSNATGAVAMFWMAGGVALSREGRGWGRWVAAAVAGAMWLAAWAGGSRSALLGAIIVTVASARAFTGNHRTWWRTAAVTVTAIVLVGTLALRVAPSAQRVRGPIQRVTESLPPPTKAGLSDFVERLWTRDRYGSVATAVIAEHPWVGIGIGNFTPFLVRLDPTLPGDNAQNWFRQVIAETGVLGGLAPFVWCALFGWWVVRRHEGEHPAAWPIRGALVAFVAMSLVGVPGEDLSVAVTFWTACAAFVMLTARPHEPQERRVSRIAALAATVLVLVFAIGTTYEARQDLRPPRWFQRTGWDYAYGVWPEEVDSDGRPFHWTRERATLLVPLNGPTLNLLLMAEHADLDKWPVQAKAWVDGRLVIDATLTPASPSASADVRVPPGERHALLETWTSRADVEPPDPRRLGLRLYWRSGPASPISPAS